jgi:hypothetical protein
MKFLVIVGLAVALMAVAEARKYKFEKMTDDLALKTFQRAHAQVALNSNVTKATSIFDAYGSVVLGLQRCDSGSPWTIHGLWAAQNYCGGNPFDANAIADLWPMLQAYWPSCSWSHNTESQFLSHEWTKHGVCFNVPEFSYFNDTLSIFLDGGWQSQCDPSQNTCDVQVS